MASQSALRNCRFSCWLSVLIWLKVGSALLRLQRAGYLLSWGWRVFLTSWMRVVLLRCHLGLFMEVKL
jgi:hypothetical protein